MELSWLLVAWKYVALMMFGFWLVQVKTKNASYVDLGWTLGLPICAWIYALGTGPMNARKGLIVTLVTIWALRLGSLLVGRLMRDNMEDARYARIRADWKVNQNFKFFWMFQFQGLLDVILSLGFLLICLNRAGSLSWIEYGAAGVWIIGFVGESVADHQLKKFKLNSSNHGRTCQEGFWKYSRHPNYFFEWLMWVAYFFMALAAPWGWTTILMPMLMYYFLMHVSGVPLAEAQSLKSRGEEYRRYQQTTSIFVPWLKKRVL